MPDPKAPAGLPEAPLLPSEDALLEQWRAEAAAARPGRRTLARLRGLVDAFVPEAILRGEALPRRRARYVVGMVLILLPCYALLVHQLVSTGLTEQAILAAVFGMGTALGLPLLRWTRSHIASGSVVCLLLVGVIFLMAYTDHGLHDPVLFWSALIPLAAALSVGPRLSVACAGLILAGAGALFWLTQSGHVFPQATPPAGLHEAAFLSVSTAALFAMLWGWLYEGQTLRELRYLNDRLSRVRGALLRSEERYRTLFENVPLGLYRSTPEGHVLMANEALLRLLGCATIEEVRALDPAREVYADPARRERFKADIARDGEVTEFVSVWRRRDGEQLVVREYARAAFDAHGNPIYYEGTVEDITEQRRVQLALRRSEERFRSLVQHASDVIVVLDRAGKVRYLSPSAARIFGYPAEPSAIPDPLALVHEEDRRRIGVLFRWALRSRGELPLTEFRVLHAEGHAVFVESVGANLLDDPNVGGLVLNVRDVTERKRAEAVLVRAKEQAEEVARLKSAFLANMSHEIRTPLTGILGFADVLAEEVTDPQQQEFVELIARSGRRLMETLNSVLELARLEAGRVELALGPLSVAERAREAVAVLEPLARDRGLTLAVEEHAPGIQARLDGPAFDRALANLIGNAIKFTERGHVTVSVEGDDAHVYVRVADTGVGIDPEFVPRLFDEFEQESTGIGRSHEGSGLGLSITRQLVERMHGAIDVESEKGVGTTFTLTFPRTDRPAAAHPEAPAPAQPATDAPSTRVLVVDDNPQTRQLLLRMLRDGFAAEAVGTAEEVLAAAARTAYDVVLLDINLGGKTSGEDVMRRLRLLPGYALTPLIAFTAYALPGDRERFLNAGFDGYLAKPFTRQELLALLAEVRHVGEPSTVVLPGPARIVAAPTPLARARVEEPSGDGAVASPIEPGG